MTKSAFHSYGWWYVNRCRKCFSLYWLTWRDDINEQLKFSNHLLTASVMAAPGAVAISKIFPDEAKNMKEEIELKQKIKTGIYYYP